MDEERSKWILEFLLRQNIEDRILNNLLSVLPLPKKDPGLNKAILIRRIGTAVSKESVDENILEILETMEELEHREGKPTAESMKAAYCSVAVDCTVRFLKSEAENNDQYIAVAERIWKERITKMEKWKRKVGLLSEELLCWKEDILIAIRESGIRDKILSMDTRRNALEAVNKYLAEAWRDLGPCYLTSVAENLVNKREETGKELAISQNSGEDVDMNGQVAGDMISKPDGDERNLEVEESEPETKSVAVCTPAKNKDAARHSQPRRRRVCGTQGAKIFNGEELEGEGSTVKSKDHEEVPRMPESGSGVQDFLSTANGDAEEEVEDINGQKKENQSGKVHQRRSTEVDDNTTDGTEKINNDQKSEPLTGSSTPLRKGLRGNDSSDKEVSKSYSSLPVNMKAASPKRRRVKKLWSPLEEDTLRKGVKKFGKGNWKLILHAYCDIFEGRNEVDLKDKWRNMTR